jgi:hypothetical protein
MSADRLLALHVLRRLVVTQGDEFRVAQMVHVGRVGVLDPLVVQDKVGSIAYLRQCSRYSAS